MVVGASGGPKIISAVLQVVLNYLFLGQTLFESMLQPRVHNQLLYHGAAISSPEASTVQAGNSAFALNITSRTRKALMDRGHALLDIDYTGTVQSVVFDFETGFLSAACDVRKGGTPSGY
jgi:gamma-glutamyltranspeptidase